MGRQALRQRRRHSLHRVARYLAPPLDEGHARIHHHDAQGSNAHTSAVLESELDWKYRIALSFETHQRAYLGCERIPHGLIDDADAQPFGGEVVSIPHVHAVHLRCAADLSSKRPRLAETARR